MPFVKGQKRFEGAGRKKGSGSIDTALTFRMPKGDFERFREVCEKLNISQGKALRDMVEVFVFKNKDLLEDTDYIVKLGEEAKKQNNIWRTK